MSEVRLSWNQLRDVRKGDHILIESGSRNVDTYMIWKVTERHKDGYLWNIKSKVDGRVRTVEPMYVQMILPWSDD